MNEQAADFSSSLTLSSLTVAEEFKDFEESGSDNSSVFTQYSKEGSDPLYKLKFTVTGDFLGFLC